MIHVLIISCFFLQIPGFNGWLECPIHGILCLPDFSTPEPEPEPEIEYTPRPMGSFDGQNNFPIIFCNLVFWNIHPKKCYHMFNSCSANYPESVVLESAGKPSLD